MRLLVYAFEHECNGSTLYWTLEVPMECVRLRSCKGTRILKYLWYGLCIEFDAKLFANVGICYNDYGLNC